MCIDFIHPVIFTGAPQAAAGKAGQVWNESGTHWNEHRSNRAAHYITQINQCFINRSSVERSRAERKHGTAWNSKQQKTPQSQQRQGFKRVSVFWNEVERNHSPPPPKGGRERVVRWPAAFGVRR